MTGLFEPDAGVRTDRSHLDGLNAAQREAVEHAGGPLIVLAGPGTGKTRVIVSRIAHLIAERDADPGSILALTFTNKAAGEMRERLGQMLDPLTAERVHAHTFNGFGASLLRRFSDLAGLPREPALIDSAQRLRMMRAIVRERALFRDAVASGIDEAIRASGRRIGAMTAAGLSPASARGRIRAHEEGLESRDLDAVELDAERALVGRLREVVDLWEAFDAECLSKGLIGFDHQISWATRMLREKAVARAFARRDYRHVVVDEFQDVNDAQIELLAQIAPPGDGAGDGTGDGPDLCVVGDDDQAIYGFRGADDRAFQKFSARWAGARTVMLEENYRSASAVLGVAALVIGRAHERFRADKVVRRADAAGEEPAGAVVEGIRLESYLQAGEVIATTIRGDLETRAGAAFGDHAVIGRNWSEIDRIRGALELEGIPCRVARGPSPKDDPGVADVLAWVDLLLNPSNAWSARRLLLRPPFQADVAWVTSVGAAYRAMLSRLFKDAAGDDETPEKPGFVGWLSAGLEDGSIACPDDTTRKAADRFVRAWTDLRAATATAPVHEAIAAIVQRTDVVHAELLDGRGRAARVSAVVALLRFARERAGRLEEPRDLRAFTAYLDDLDEKDASFRVARLSHEDDEAAENGSAEEGADAVTLLTAHGAKGLEFDTVHLPRVESQHGYPSVRESDPEETIPLWLAEGEDGAHGDGNGARAALEDEERRLFYVACTRAERRLVLLGKVPKSRPKNANYFWELLCESGLIVEREAAEVLGSDARDGVDHETAETGWASRDERRTRIRSAARIARLDAARALADAGEAGDDGARFESAVADLRDAAARLAVIESAARRESAPAWIEDEGLVAMHAALMVGDERDGALDRVVRADAVLPRMTGKLRLNYTMLDQWERCPRCFASRFVLKVPEAETAKTVVGKAVHSALEAFYTAFRKAGAEEGAREPTLDDLLAMGDAAFDASWSKSEVVDRDQRDRVRALLRQGYDALHDATLNPVAIEQEIRFPYTPGGDAAGTGPHWFTSKIDRIDESAGGYRVVDYKTGRATKKITEVDKKDLQFGIYAMAVRAYAAIGPDFEGPVGAGGEDYGDEAGAGGSADVKAPAIVGPDVADLPIPAGGAEYWVLSSGERGRVSFDELAEYEGKLREKIDRAIRGMLDGAYPKGRGCQGFCAMLDPGELAAGG